MDTGAIGSNSLGAFRQYQITKQALGPETLKESTRANSDEAQPSVLTQGVQEFSEVFENVETATQAFATGQADAHSVVEALATAEVALEAAVTVRNRVVEAYQELLRMPV